MTFDLSLDLQTLVQVACTFWLAVSLRGTLTKHGERITVLENKDVVQDERLVKLEAA